MLVDDVLPVYDVSDSVATVVDADLAATWDALLQVDLIEVGRRRPLLAVLGGVRALPDVIVRLLTGEAQAAPTTMRLHDLTALPLDGGGWILLGERPRDEIALGLVGKFWRPVIAFAAVGSDGFRNFAEAGSAKTVYSLSVRARDAHRTLLAGVMRTATTDEHARRWFRRYWTLGVGSGGPGLVNGLLHPAAQVLEAGGARARRAP